MKTKRLILIGLLTLSTIGSSMASDLAAREANQELLRCQYKAALQLDDSYSDVRSIAPAVANSCQRESDRFFHIARKKFGSINESEARQIVREKDLDTATRLILMKRAEERKASR